MPHTVYHVPQVAVPKRSRGTYARLDDAQARLYTLRTLYPKECYHIESTEESDNATDC